MIKKLKNHFKNLFYDKRGTRLRPKIIDVYTTSSVVEDLSAGGIAVGAVDTTATFSSQRKSCLIYNAGPNQVHINFDATATTNNFIIPPKWSMSIVFPVTVLHFVCDPGNSCTLYILGER